MRWLRATALVGTILAVGVARAAAPPQGDSGRRGSDDEGQASRRERVIVRPGIDIPRAGGPELGVAIRDIDQDLAKEHKLASAEGALVQQVRSGSTAEKAGMKAGDVITEFDGERVRSVRHLQRLVADTPIGRSVRVSVLRDGTKVELSATLQRGSGEIGGGTFEAPDLEELGRDLTDSVRDLPKNFRFYFDDGGELAPRFRGGREPFTWRADPLLPWQPLFEGPATGRLGAIVQELTPQLGEFFGAKDGVLVVTVNPDTPAARAGLKAGDVVTSVDGKPVQDTVGLVRLLRGAADGAEVSLGVVRAHKTVTLRVRLVGQKPGRPA